MSKGSKCVEIIMQKATASHDSSILLATVKINGDSYFDSI